jgi:hypothetical protein
MMDKRTQLKNLLIYYSKPIESLPIYLAGVDDITDDVLSMAIADLVKTSTFMPRVQELRTAARAVMAAMSEADRTTGDQLTTKLNEMYDAALDGHFDAENMLRHILLLRVSDREESAAAWKRRYDQLTGDLVVDRYELAAQWGNVDAPDFSPEALKATP